MLPASPEVLFPLLQCNCILSHCINGVSKFIFTSLSAPPAM